MRPNGRRRGFGHGGGPPPASVKLGGSHVDTRVTCDLEGALAPRDPPRRLSLWHGQGIPAREIGDRARQRQIAVTLDVYTHTMPLDEVSLTAFEKVLVS